jgi:hypothetical protein
LFKNKIGIFSLFTIKTLEKIVCDSKTLYGYNMEVNKFLNKLSSL